ncbi:hypothetical protein [Paraburkholderia ferrariae]|uniref:Uncharacterized protein n=1 Tax=Paraburkholderia ferrariae TaxID=386056 RepID=A0ABU9RIG7_9BURK
MSEDNRNNARFPEGNVFAVQFFEIWGNVTAQIIGFGGAVRLELSNAIDRRGENACFAELHHAIMQGVTAMPVPVELLIEPGISNTRATRELAGRYAEYAKAHGAAVTVSLAPDGRGEQ